jgi:raffinose/stachyose/melibiose transport system permease protein
VKIRWYTALAFILPAFLIYSLGVLYPAARGLSYSFTEFSGVGEARFVGLENYQRIFANASSLEAIRNTLVYAVIVVVVQNVFGLALAVWMGNNRVLRDFTRVALFTPSILSGVVVGFLWTYIYAPDGALNGILVAIGLGSLQQIWLGDPMLALGAVATVQVWMFTGQTAAIYLANYLNIPQDLRDSAIIDGAGFWQRFRYIEWPLLGPATTISVTLTLIGALRVFDLPWLLTQGGPINATEVLGISIFRAAFREQRFGYGAALSTVLAVFVLAVAIVQVRFLRSREVQG